ncbi:uncharacterized protein LOC117515513 [Thalassophryne amazonica]|uniref:uncharacterized protein LOC117515513 n=1 Tax=Thalassophryne amazonica TaxID=390379 RepID=UPI001471EF48|nr:uncharacterized protein LOC117515513 [Thalassophryne amazonica]
MMCSAAALGAVVLWITASFSTANKGACDVYAASEQSVTLPFVYGALTNSQTLRWTHNNAIIFYRESGSVSVGKPTDVSSTGSLLLKNVKASSSGLYKAVVLHANTTIAQTWSGHLCVMDKVPQPQLSYVCDSKSNTATLTCYVAKPQGLTFSWSLNDKTLTSETKQVLIISLKKLTEGNFSCGVANKVSEDKSTMVHVKCEGPAVLCFAPQTVMAVLAGGAGLILFLLIFITVMLCGSRRRRKCVMSPSNEGDVRMCSLNQQQAVHISPDYETMCPGEGSPSPSPKPSPRACYCTAPQPESRNQQLPAGPSPVPKPRTRNPQASVL